MDSKLNSTVVPVTKFFAAIHANANNKGFWGDNDNITEKIMLVVTELSEAVEAMRNQSEHDFVQNNLHNSQVVDAMIGRLQMGAYSDMKEFDSEFRVTIKDTVGDELADAVIRIIDLCMYTGINLWSHIIAKAEFNKGRAYKHGKEF